jgi:hypothetical protein
MAGRSSAPSLPREWWLESFGLNWCGASVIHTLGSIVVRNDSKLADGGGSTFLASTAVHGLTWDLLTPRMGSRASTFSPRDPSLVQLLREAVNWCLRRPLQVLGFDLKRAEIQALWLPIYRGFSLISKRIRLWSCFDPSIELIYALVRVNLKGTNSMRSSGSDSASTPWWRRDLAGPLLASLSRAQWSFFGQQCGLCTGEKSSARLGRQGGFSPRRIGKMKKAFDFSNLF